MSDKPHLAKGDEELLKAAQTGEGLIELTPELWQKIADNLKARTEEIGATYEKLVEACPNEMKLAVVAWTMKHIVDHAVDPGSFRYLIYNRMGFGAEAYLPLYTAGGMTITNEFELPPGFDMSSKVDTCRVPVEPTSAMIDDIARWLPDVAVLKTDHDYKILAKRIWESVLKAAGRDVGSAVGGEG